MGKPDWGVTILWDPNDEPGSIEKAANKWAAEFEKITTGTVLIRQMPTTRTDVNKILDGHKSDGVFIYIGHGRNDGQTPFPILGDGVKGRDIVEALQRTRSTVIFNCCNRIKSRRSDPVDVAVGNAVVLFAQPNSYVELGNSSIFLDMFKKALRRQTDHQLAALEADKKIMNEWKERFNVYITEDDENLEIAALDDEESFKVTVNKSKVLSNATSPVEDLIPFAVLADRK